MSEVVTPDKLARIISKKLGIGKKEAREYADIVMDIFGFDDTISDNMPYKIRRLFYILEEKGILTTKRETFPAPNGTSGRWRTFYWSLNKKMVLQ